MGLMVCYCVFRVYRRLGLLSILLCCVVWVIGCLGLKVSGMVVGWLLGLLAAWVVLGRSIVASAVWVACRVLVGVLDVLW